MTIIAWDGKTLAADRMATNCGYGRTVTKIFRVPAGLVGFAGDGSRAMALLQWFKDGANPATYPEFQKEGDCVGVLMVGNDGRGYGYSHTPYPTPQEDPFDAIGSGRDYALAVMHLGFDAVKAVEVASALDCNCGKGIDVLTLGSEVK